VRIYAYVPRVRIHAHVSRVPTGILANSYVTISCEHFYEYRRESLRGYLLMKVYLWMSLRISVRIFTRSNQTPQLLTLFQHNSKMLSVH